MVAYVFRKWETLGYNTEDYNLHGKVTINDSVILKCIELQKDSAGSKHSPVACYSEHSKSCSLFVKDR